MNCAIAQWLKLLRLPQMHPQTIRQIHFVSGFDAEGFVEFGDVGEWAVDAVLGRAVHIGEELGGYAFGALAHHPAQ